VQNSCAEMVRRRLSTHRRSWAATLQVPSQLALVTNRRQLPKMSSTFS
jgi:hypothetical protein